MQGNLPHCCRTWSNIVGLRRARFGGEVSEGWRGPSDLTVGRSPTAIRSYLLRYPSHEPARRAQEARVAVAGTDELNTERQAVLTLHERRADRRHSAQRPERGEDRLARRGQSLRRGAGGSGREDRVVALLEDLAERPVHRAESGQRAEIVERAHLAATLDPCAQVIRQAIASLFPLELEIHRY